MLAQKARRRWSGSKRVTMSDGGSQSVKRAGVNRDACALQERLWPARRAMYEVEEEAREEGAGRMSKGSRVWKVIRSGGVWSAHRRKCFKCKMNSAERPRFPFPIDRGHGVRDIRLLPSRPRSFPDFSCDGTSICRLNFHTALLALLKGCKVVGPFVPVLCCRRAERRSSGVEKQLNARAHQDVMSPTRVGGWLGRLVMSEGRYW